MLTEEYFKERSRFLGPKVLNERIWEFLSERSTNGDEQLIKNGGSVLIPNRGQVLEFENLVVDKVLTIDAGGDLGPDEYNLLLVRNELLFKEGGEIISSQNLKIRATSLRCDAVATGGVVKARISSVSGAPGSSGEPFTTSAKNGPNGLKAGADRGEANHTESGARGGDGNHGENADHGENGREGDPGGNGSNIYLDINKFDARAELHIASNGGDGGTGGPGQDGGIGGTGRRGGKGGLGGKGHCWDRPGRGGDGGRGGDAGRGGDGGRGGLGGDAGNGGDITIYYRESFQFPFNTILDNLPGDPGGHGDSGVPGQPGEPGAKGLGNGGGGGKCGHRNGGHGGDGLAGNKNTPGNQLLPFGDGRTGKEGSEFGPIYNSDPPVWPFSGHLSEKDWLEILK